MPRLPQGAYNRLLGLLYKKTAPEINTKVPIVKKVLYNDVPDDSQNSVLDDLVQRLNRQKPMDTAVEDVANALPNVQPSNLLRFACKNAYVGGQDLENIFPINRERNYLLEPELHKGLRFQTVKARNPISLSFTGAYYLIFPNMAQACVYYMETRNKLVNGVDLNLEFIHPTEQHLKRMSSPYLQRDSVKVGVASDNVGQTPISDIFAGSEFKLRIIDQLAQLNVDSTVTGRNMDPVYELLSFFVDANVRNRLVLVRNLPFGVSEPALQNLLWDYELDNLDEPQHSIMRLEADPITQSSLTLIKFSDQIDAIRFVRNYHGRKWEKMMTRKDKPLYEPLLCEIVD